MACPICNDQHYLSSGKLCNCVIKNISDKLFFGLNIEAKIIKNNIPITSFLILNAENDSIQIQNQLKYPLLKKYIELQILPSYATTGDIIKSYFKEEGAKYLNFIELESVDWLIILLNNILISNSLLEENIINIMLTRMNKGLPSWIIKTCTMKEFNIYFPNKKLFPILEKSGYKKIDL